MRWESLHDLRGLPRVNHPGGDPRGLSALSHRDLCTLLQGER
jgi:hypothetical protein